jgi:CRISPR-associated protein Cmr2
VARKIQDAGGELIFPEKSSVAANSKDAVANVVIAVVTTDSPSGIADGARVAAQGRWKAEADGVLKDADISGEIVWERWNRQVDDVVECYAAWVPLEKAEHYSRQRQRVMRLLAGRKACRNFGPSRETEMLIPKSSLDGARETVLVRKDADRPAKLRLNGKRPVNRACRPILPSGIFGACGRTDGNSGQR